MPNYCAVTPFDLDRTLLDTKSETVPKMAKAINALKRNNVLPVIATRHTEAGIHFIMEDAGITSAVIMNDPFVRVGGEEIHSRTFSSEECQKMYDHVQLNGHELSYYNNQKIWCANHSQTMINAYNFIHSGVPEIGPLGFKENTVSMLLILSQLGDEYYHEHFPELTFYRNSPYLINTVRKGISKGAGVRRLQRELQLEKVPTSGFGDGLNDFALLETYDNKITMGNACDGLKELSTFTTERNTESGIAHVLEYFGLV